MRELFIETQERLKMNQMPDLASLEADDVLMSIQSLLDWKENKS